MKAWWRLVIAALVGFSVGLIPAGVYYRQQARAAPPQWLYTYHTGQAIADLDTLIALRRGKTDDVISNVEWDLSTQIHDLYQVFPDEALSRKDSVRILKSAARYRLEHPFKTGSEEKDRVVEEVLAKAGSIE